MSNTYELAAVVRAEVGDIVEFRTVSKIVDVATEFYRDDISGLRLDVLKVQTEKLNDLVEASQALIENVQVRVNLKREKEEKDWKDYQKSVGLSENMHDCSDRSRGRGE